MTLLAVLVVAVQAATGATWWALLRRSDRVSVLELLGMGLALGSFAAMLSSILLVTTALAPIAWLLPTIAVVPVALVARARGLMTGFGVRAPVRESVAGLIGLLSGLALVVANWTRVPLSAPSTDSFADLYFFEALSRGLAQFGPAESILMSGGSLRYHWFTYAWSGELAQAAGTGPFVVLTRVLPVVVLVGVSAIVAAWAARLSAVRWVPSLAVLLVVVGGYAGALYGSILNFDSPSQAMTTLWLLALAVAFLDVVRRRSGPATLLAVAALAAACTGGKISHAAVAAGGITLVIVVGLITRAEWSRRAFVGGAVAAASMAITYVLVLSGVAIDRNLAGSVAVKASTWQGLDPVDGRIGVALGTIALVLAVLARLGGIGWLLARRSSRTTPEVVFATGALLVGLGVMMALRDGVNDLWFVLAASAPAAAVAATGVGVAMRRLRRSQSDGPLRRAVPWAAIVAVPATVTCLVLSRNWTEHQPLLNWLAPVSVWILVPVTAAIVVAAAGRGPRRLTQVAALSVAALAIVSIATRPAAVWTSSREVTTGVGTVLPDQGLGVAPDLESVVPATVTGTFVATPEQQYAWAAEAADWVDANVPVDALVGTGDPASAIVPALTGRQSYLAGERYQAGLGRAAEFDVVSARALAARAFAAAPSRATAGPLCEAGVDYVWLDRPGSVGTAGQVVFSNAGVTIVSLEGPDCG